MLVTVTYAKTFRRFIQIIQSYVTINQLRHATGTVKTLIWIRECTTVRAEQVSVAAGGKKYTF